MNDENPDPWNSEHPQKEDWPPQGKSDGMRGCVRKALIVLGVIAVIIGMIFVGCVMSLDSALKH